MKVYALSLMVLAAACNTKDNSRATLRDADVVAPDASAQAPASAPEVANDCTARWEVFSSKPYEQIALPDTNVNYWRFRFKVPAGKPIALRVRGEYPKARYANFNVYDQKTQNSSASLADIRITPDEGAQNPYRAGADRAASPRGYTVWALPGAPTEGEANVVRQPVAPPAATEQLLELWYRIYLPDPGTDATGGAPLPTIEAFADESATQPVACPARAALEPSILNAAAALPPENPPGEIFLFRSRATGLYANLDNVYLGTRIRLLGGNVVVLRFKAPTFPDSGAGLASFTGQEDVRYWSFCLGGLDQKTSSCLNDSQAKVDANGFVTLTIGPEELRQKALMRGQSFLPWGNQLFQAVVYRNLLTRDDFAGSMKKVKQVEENSTFNAATFAAQKFIGEYAPVGKRCNKAKYLVGNCGMP